MLAASNVCFLKTINYIEVKVQKYLFDINGLTTNIERRDEKALKSKFLKPTYCSFYRQSRRGDLILQSYRLELETINFFTQGTVSLLRSIIAIYLINFILIQDQLFKDRSTLIFLKDLLTFLINARL